MNSQSRPFLILMALPLALPARAQEPKPVPPAAPAAPAAPAKEATGARSRIDSAFEALRQKALAGDKDRAAYQELVAAIRGGYGVLEHATPNTEVVRKRLSLAVDDLFERSQRAKIAPEELGALRVELLDADLQCLLAQLAAQPNAQGLEALSASYKQLADAVGELDPSAAEGRTRAQALLDGLKSKPAVEPADLEPLTEELAHARAQRAEVLLEKRAVAKGATKTDYARARDHVSDLLELQSKRDPEARELQKKLVGAIEELERRGAESSLTHADFESLRKELAQRGRTAL